MSRDGSGSTEPPMSRDGSGSTELESSEVSPGRPGSRVVPRAGDENTETYWQSDGGQPHLINVQFHKKMSIVEIAFYLDYNLDESYTPKKLSARLAARAARARAVVSSAPLPPPSRARPDTAARRGARAGARGHDLP